MSSDKSEYLLVVILLVMNRSNRSFSVPLPPFLATPQLFDSIEKYCSNLPQSQKAFPMSHHMSIWGYQMPQSGGNLKSYHILLFCLRDSFRVLLKPTLQTGCNRQHCFYSIFLWLLYNTWKKINVKHNWRILITNHLTFTVISGGNHWHITHWT